MAAKYILPEGKTLEEERARITQNLSVVAHQLYFTVKHGLNLDVDYCVDEMAEAVRFINYLYETIKGEEIEKSD